MTSRIFCGVASCSTCADASTPSASMQIAVSAVCGTGPGYSKSAGSTPLPSRSLRLLQEIRDAPGAVVLADERLQPDGEAVLLRELDAFADVIADDRGARRGLELVVRVAAARLVLDEVFRLLDLADVVIVGTDPREQSVGADRIARRFGEIGDPHGVGERPGRFDAQPAQAAAG